MSNDKLNDMFAADYESFLIDDEPQNNVFEFDELCSTVNYLIGSASEFDSPSNSLKIETAS